MLTDIINVALLDSSALFRRMLRNYLSDQKGINVIIHTPDIFDLFNKLEGFAIDILLIDVFNPKLNGIETLKMIYSKYPELKILIISECTDIQLISDLLDLGIYGYISKTDEPEELLLAITTISNNRIYCNKLFTEALYWNKQSNITPRLNGSIIALDEREQQILQLLWEEKSNKEIADELYLSIRSIEKIRQNMKEKLGVKSTVGLLKYGITKKIISTAPH